MSTQVKQSKQTTSKFAHFSLSQLFFTTYLSEKFQFAFKVALSLTLAYLIPMGMGWAQPSTAAITVMLIASTGSRRESLAKGCLRILGTLCGAAIGLFLVACFAQDRFAYLLSVSIIVSIIFYLRNAYKSDPTLFMLTGVVIMMMSNGGDTNGAFLYGIERAFMTCFGVVVYTLIGTFVFPAKVEQNLQQLTSKVTGLQKKLLSQLMLEYRTPATSTPKQDAPQDTQSLETTDTDNSLTPESEPEKPVDEALTAASLLTDLQGAQQGLIARYESLSRECSDISAYQKEWDVAIESSQQITTFLNFAVQNHADPSFHLDHYIKNLDEVLAHLDALFLNVETQWHEKSQHSVPAPMKIELNSDPLSNASHFHKANTYSLVFILNKLQTKLSDLAQSVACIDSLTGSLTVKAQSSQKASRFLWWDAENAKTALKVLCVFWFSAILWIYFNPPRGYKFVIFSTMYMSLVSFLPIHPVLLLVLFTFGFVFAIPAYVFILPNLTHGVELGLFIFSYAFIGFYLFKGPLTLMFLMGLFLLGINNTMHYSFPLLLSIMLLFHLVVFVIILSHYIPFSSRPETLYLTFKERFFRNLSHVFRIRTQAKPSALRLKLHLQTLNVAAKKMNVWATKINYTYFNLIQKEQLAQFSASCNRLAQHITMLMKSTPLFAKNPIVQQSQQHFSGQLFSEMAIALSHCNLDEFNQAQQQFEQVHHVVETKLEEFLASLDLSQYTEQDIATFYIYLNLNKNIYQAMNQCNQAYLLNDWSNLQQNRF